MATKNELQRHQEENSQLREEVEKLRNEMIRLIGRNLDLSEQLEQTTAVQGVRRTDSGDGRSYRLNGAPATEATRDLVIRDGQKIVR